MLDSLGHLNQFAHCGMNSFRISTLQMAQCIVTCPFCHVLTVHLDFTVPCVFTATQEIHASRFWYNVRIAWMHTFKHQSHAFCCLEFHLPICPRHVLLHHFSCVTNKVTISATSSTHQHIVPVPSHSHHKAIDFTICCNWSIICQHRSLGLDAVVVDFGKWTGHHVEVCVHDCATTFFQILVPQVIIEHSTLVFQHVDAIASWPHCDQLGIV